MSLLLKAAVTALAGAVTALVLRRSAPEIAFALGAAASLLAAFFALEMFSELGEIIEMAKRQTGLSPAVLGPVMKCVGVGVVTRLTADMCRDAGQSAAGSAVELCGTVCAMAAALPLLRALMELIGSIA